jgi:hypothetical protein
MKLRQTVFFIHNGNTVQDCSSRVVSAGVGLGMAGYRQMWRIPAGGIAMLNPANNGPEAVSRTMNAHILVFECPNCGRPMPFIRLAEGIRYPNLEQEVERVALGCLGADCGWSGTFATGAARQSRTVKWPHLKPAGSYENQRS